MDEINSLLNRKNFDLVDEIFNFNFSDLGNEFQWELLTFIDTCCGEFVNSEFESLRTPESQLMELVCDVMIVEQRRVYNDLLQNKLFSSLVDHLNSVDLLSKDNLLKFRGRKYLDNHLNSLVESSIPFSYLMLDLDYFSDVNNNYGHLVGDEVLTDLGDLIRGELRQSDVPYLYGGDEVGIVLPGTYLNDANFVAEKLRKSIDNNLVVGCCKLDSNFSSYNLSNYNSFISVDCNITCSIGVSEFSNSDISGLAAIKRADMALYVSKNSGKNMVSLK